METVEVVVVGAGPVGLMQACELRLAGVRPMVIERRAEPGDLPRANGVVGQIVQLLDYRGLLDRFRAQSPFAGPMPGFPFGSVPLNFTKLGTSPVRAVMIQQPRMEALLAERARELDVEIRRGHELRALSQDDDGVTLEIRGPAGMYTVRTAYLVGCDGGRSPVREHAGIDFPGTTDRQVMRLGHFTSLDATPLRPGWNRTPHGRLLVTSLTPGVHIVSVREDDPTPVDFDTPMTLAELQASIRRVHGADLPLGEPIWLSRTVSQARLAQRYRAGRVLLAGDAAHLFPAGGSALNVGLTDAVNLGWKLAAEIQGWAPPGLLDTYHAERHPVGARTLMQTRAQAVLDSVPGDDGDALRELFTELVQFEPPLRHLAETLNGTENLAPDLHLTTADGPIRVAELLRSAKPVLLDLADNQELRDTAAKWADRISVVTAHCDQAPADGVLIRPDGIVAWEGAVDGLREALSRWCGAPPICS